VDTTKSKGLLGALVLEIKAERAAAELTVQQLADRTGISKSKLDRIIAGQQDIAVTDIASLSEVFNIEPAELLAHAQKRKERAGL
jgi:transcriptional regulator with XRE-family HTH domain